MSLVETEGFYKTFKRNAFFLKKGKTPLFITHLANKKVKTQGLSMRR